MAEAVVGSVGNSVIAPRRKELREWSAAALASTGVLSAAAALGLQHVVMIPAMLAVMLWRYDEYSHSHTQHS